VGPQLSHNDHMIGFYTKFTTTESKRDAFIEILLEAATAMKAIDDCLIYLVNKDANTANITWVTEVWTNKEAHEASLKMQGAKELISKALPLLTGRPEQIEIVPVGGKGF